MALILHIGTPKTGSTAVQHFLVQNETALNGLGYSYFKQHRSGHLHEDFFDNFDAARCTALAEELKRFRHVVLSFEGAYLVPENVVRRLSAFTADTRILLFVRNTESWVNSLLNQFYKGPRISFSYIENFLKFEGESLELFDVDRHLRRWERYFDRSAIHVRPYQYETPVREIMLDVMGVGPEDRRQLVFSDQTSNTAADLRLIRALRWMKREIGDGDTDLLVQATRKLTIELNDARIDTRVAPAPMLLDDRQRDILRARFEAANAELCARYALDADSLNGSGGRGQMPPAERLDDCPDADVAIARRVIDECSKS